MLANPVLVVLVGVLAGVLPGVFGFGGRTGGVWMEQGIDNVIISTPLDVLKISPKDGATDVEWDAVLSWDAPEVALGEDEAYQISLQTDPNNPASGTSEYVTETTYTPAEPLSVDTEYFWKIDIVDMSNTEPNLVSQGIWWSFTTKGIKPDITVNPSNVLVWPGETASFTCQATSDMEVTYQWYKDDVAISGEISTVLTIEGVQESDAADYYCVATNTHGDTQSASASLAIKHMLGWWKLDGDVKAVEGFGSDGTINNAPADANDMFTEGMDGLAIGVNINSEFEASRSRTSLKKPSTALGTMCSRTSRTRMVANCSSLMSSTDPLMKRWLGYLLDRRSITFSEKSIPV